MRMKKITCIVITLCMMLALCACDSPSAAKPSAHDYIVDTNFDILEKDDPIYDEIADMLGPVIKFVEYNHILGNTIDYSNVNAEEFWNIVAITASAYSKSNEIGKVDAAGVLHLKWDDMMNIAKTFLYKSWAVNQTPSYAGSYSASADPGSGIIDLIPLGVDNFDGSLVAIEMAKDDSDYEYVLDIDLATKDGAKEIHHYKVYLASWEYAAKQYDKKNDDTHIFPFMVDMYYYVGTDELEN